MMIGRRYATSSTVMKILRPPWNRTLISRSSITPLLSNQSPYIKRHYGTDIGKVKRESDLKDTDTSAETTGVVDVDETREVLVYFDHIFADNVSSFKLKQYLNIIRANSTDMGALKKQVMGYASTVENPLPEGSSIIDFVPLQRDAGAFVKFSVPDGTTPKELLTKICSNVKLHKKESTSTIWKYIVSMVSGQSPDVFPVKGVPWIEDLRRFPSPKIKVKFEGDPLTEEELYVLLRRYGTLIDIVPQSSSVPYAQVTFKRIRAAICAKNCITGMHLKDVNTTLHLQYIPIKRANYVADFVSNHQRIAIPAILAILATLAVIIFDPVRQFFIEEKIEHKLSLQAYADNRYFKFITRPVFWIQGLFCNSYDYIGEALNAKCADEAISNESDLGTTETISVENLWAERYDKIKQLKLWIYENVGTFIIVKGPKGSGKRELVVENTLLEDETLRRKILYIDCEAIVKSRTDNKLIEALADQVGYYPVFSWVNSISQFVDLGVQSITGQKSGISESKETQIKNMFSLTSQAIRTVALRDYNRYEKEVQRKRKIQEHRKRQNPEADIKLDEIMNPEEYLQQHPESKPIVVINKFSSKSGSSGNEYIYKMVADWSGSLIQNNSAHVIYITNDVGAISQLNNSLPNQVFKTISLNDASEAGSYAYVMNQLRDLRYEKFDTGIIKSCLKPLGGRMLDLQAFIRRIRSGETPHESLNELVTQAAEQITTFFLFNSSKPDDQDYKNWDPLQVWELVKLLSSKDSVDYNDLTIKSSLFKANNQTAATLSALEKNDLIALKRDKGVLSEITTGRPIYKEAFRKLVEDNEIFKHFEVSHYNSLIKVETAKIYAYEDELSKVNFKEVKLDNRLKYLVDKIDGSNSKILNYEQTLSEIKGRKSTSSSFLGIF